ncbi:MAG: hypothetical protein FWD17_11905 [Polyangiaceae bacterium]|nr:hypothetical protein [Polyangiaceae bacterium]
MPVRNPWKAYRETLEHSLRGDFNHASEEARADAASRLIESSSIAAAVLACQPFPGVDTVLIGPVHRELLDGIAHIRGIRADRKDVYRDLLSPLAIPLFLQHAAMFGTKLVPFVDVLAVPIAYALTHSLGRLADEHFRCGRSMSPQELRARFGATYKTERALAFREKRDELKALLRDQKVRRQIDKIKDAGRRGAMSREEVARRIDEILARS